MRSPWLVAAGIVLGTLPLCTIARLGSEVTINGPVDVLKGESARRDAEDDGNEDSEDKDGDESKEEKDKDADGKHWAAKKDKKDDGSDDKDKAKGGSSGNTTTTTSTTTTGGTSGNSTENTTSTTTTTIVAAGKDDGSEDKDKAKGDNTTNTTAKDERPNGMTKKEIEEQAKKDFKELDDKLDWKITEKDWVKLQLSSCMTFDDCGKDKVLKRGAENLFCEKDKCTHKDRWTCCAKPAKCGDYECPSGLVPIQPEPTCSSNECGPEDAITCCGQPKAPCNPIACTITFALNPNATGTCAGPACDPAVDQGTCCMPKMSCSNFTCPPGQTMNPGPPLCGLSTCTPADAPICCHPLPTCATLGMPPNFSMCPDGTSLKDEAPTLYCGPLGCNATDIPKCCGPQATCDTLACPEPVYYNLSSEVEEPLYCAKGLCDPVLDTPRCCKARGLCMNFTCPKHYSSKMKDAGDDPVYCELDVCKDSDVDACCEAPSSGGWIWYVVAVLIGLVALALIGGAAVYIVQMDPKKFMGGGSSNSGAAYSRTSVSPEDAAANDARGRPGPDRPPSASDPPSGLGGLGGVDGPPQRRAGPGASGTGPRSGPGAFGGPGRGASDGGAEGNAASGER
mmetsp:Transcript_15530/g.35541  ORF Transcript_15530/g.35541 Transcript_15530/m.35541 type:complete len:622 (+) Transcript_15530:84-1949(+)